MAEPVRPRRHPPVWEVIRHPRGWVVGVSLHGRELRRYYGDDGCETHLPVDPDDWERVLAGAGSVRAPRDELQFTRWVKRRLAAEVREMRERLEKAS